MNRFRTKHVFLPLAAITIMGSVLANEAEQKSKFNSDVWKEARYEDVSGDRAELIDPLMAHILKVGMSIKNVDELMGQPDLELGESPEPVLGEPSIIRIYNFNRRDYASESLVLEFSRNGKLINFYIKDQPQPFIF